MSTDAADRDAARVAVTIRSVARAAGVSVGTVSNVLNHPERVAPATVAAVTGEIERQGFVPRSSARDLAGLPSPTVGMIVPDLTNELFLSLSRGAQLHGPESGMEVLLANSGRAWAGLRGDHAVRQARLIRTFVAARVRGIILGAMDDPRPAVDPVRDLIPALVVVNYLDPQPTWCTVVMDNVGIGRAAVAHLAEAGATELAFVSAADVVQPISERRTGIRAAAAEAGLPLVEVEVDDLHAAQGRRAVRELLADSTGDRRLGILAVSDRLALGALEALRDAGRRVPEDVLVLGLDGNLRGDAPDWVGLTSIELPAAEMGRIALELVHEELHDPEHVHTTVVVPAGLVPRASTIGRATG